MKKKLLFGLLVFMTIGLWSCSSDKDDEYGSGNSVIPILSETGVNNDLADFFKTELPMNSDLPSTGFFVDSNKDICHVVNSMEELKSLYKGEKELPVIDFNSQTLVIGQRVMPHLGYTLQKQYIKEYDGSLLLFLHIKCEPSDFYPTMLMKLYYWGIYPKINKTTITVKTIEQ